MNPVTSNIKIDILQPRTIVEKIFLSHVAGFLAPTLIKNPKFSKPLSNYLQIKSFLVNFQTPTSKFAKKFVYRLHVLVWDSTGRGDSTQRRIQNSVKNVDGAFYENSQRLLAGNYFHKSPHLRCLLGFRIRLCKYNFITQYGF